MANPPTHDAFFFFIFIKIKIVFTSGILKLSGYYIKYERQSFITCTFAHSQTPKGEFGNVTKKSTWKFDKSVAIVEGIYGLEDRMGDNTSSFVRVYDGEQQDDALFQNEAVT